MLANNDTQLEPISWEFDIGNQLLNFCVGVGVRGHDAYLNSGKTGFGSYHRLNYVKLMNRTIRWKICWFINLSVNRQDIINTLPGH